MNNDIPKLNGETEPLYADKQELAKFHRALFCNAKNGYISLRGFAQDQKIAFIESFHFDDPLLLPALERLATHAANMANVVFCTPIATFIDKISAAGTNLANGLAISVDIDQSNPKDGCQLLESLLGPATIVIEKVGVYGRTRKIVMKHIPNCTCTGALTQPTDSEATHNQLKKVRRSGRIRPR